MRPDLELTGFGGPLMEKAGVTLFGRYETGVMGFLEIIRHIPRHWELLQTVRDRFETNDVKLLVVIDYPGFNMKAAAAAAEAGLLLRPGRGSGCSGSRSCSPCTASGSTWGRPTSPSSPATSPLSGSESRTILVSLIASSDSSQR